MSNNPDESSDESDDAHRRQRGLLLSSPLSEGISTVGRSIGNEIEDSMVAPLKVNEETTRESNVLWYYC